MAKTKSATKKVPAAKTKKTAKAAPKKAKAASANGKPKKMSAIDAAAKVLADSKQPMNCKELIEAMSAKGLWTSPGGATPWATLYSAIIRELKVKGKEARFTKTERGKFAAN
jgi:ethanolamine utilization cobalamin adenosyltransferase